MIEKKSPTVLLVEDDDVDAERVHRAAKRAEFPYPIRRVLDGAEALATLREEIPPPLKRPCIVLLDLKLPRMGGLQFLQEIRGDALLRPTVVFVLSTSCSEVDRERAFENCVAGFISKDQPDGDFERVIQMLRRYLDTVEIP